ncbi:hypothetical protein [Leptolyngbya sp. 7M]|uniref:hypothetical protein n=1 Tax=Leptolyngbya sp. 7M TaxID=2812896 RepID=UPI001B8C95B7|nr:hypothetical protein [Leptolyngbya sp. 7M]QYO63485.1 hypothetical protein JVX88_26860 [Leptolyngbya sp. 7M]
MTIAHTQLSATDKAFRVEGYEKIDYSLLCVDGVFDLHNPQLAESYRSFGRCLAVIDANVERLYGSLLRNYFKYYELDLTVFPITITEPNKSIDTSAKCL